MEVEKRHWSLETQASDLTESDIGLAPLPDNSYTCGKCGFKILQYAAAGLPVVASPVGVNAQYVQPDVNGLLASDIGQWIDAITKLIKDKQLKERMGQQSLAMAKDFDISIVGQKLVRLIKGCMSRAF